MHENSAYPWQVAELAQKADLSRSVFAQRFKALLGDTPVNYMTKVRIQESMDLLARTDENIERISETVEFGTGFALSKAFKRVTGPLLTNIGCARLNDSVIRQQAWLRSYRAGSANTPTSFAASSCAAFSTTVSASRRVSFPMRTTISSPSVVVMP
jgi:AraC-like DNA-binding protein